MNIIRKSSFAEMVLEWLKAELMSSRFSSDLKQAIQDANVDEKIITEADINNHNENEQRLDILRKYRDWFDVDVNAYDWQLVELNQDEVGKLKYIDYDYWNELSGGTRLVEKAAENIKQGSMIFDVPNDNFYSVAEAVEAGSDFLPIIIVSKQDGEEDIIEGHVRVTGYALADNVTKPLSAIVGINKLS